MLGFALGALGAAAAFIGARRAFQRDEDLFGQVAIDPSIEAPAVEGDDLLAVVRDGAWQTLLVLVLTAASAALGGVVGARRELREPWSRVAMVRPRV